MGLLDSLRGGDGQGDEDERRRAADVERIESGSIPLAAERRMRELAAGTTSFTSGLSVADFALCRQAGVRPVAQVMGSSVYQVGWQRYPWSTSMAGGGQGFELETLSQAWNDARRRALDRLAQEAQLAGCHGVVDVTFSGRRHEFLDGEIEIVVSGTGVVVDGVPSSGDRPVLTDLSMPDFALLRGAGYDPIGVVAATSVMYVVPSIATMRLGGLFQLSQPNQEVPDYTAGLAAARERALARANNEAWRSGATAVVGVTLDQQIELREVDQRGSGTRRDLIVTFHVLGTGIVAPGEHRPLWPQTVVRQGAARS